MRQPDVIAPTGLAGRAGADSKEAGNLKANDSWNLSAVKAVEHARLMLEFAAVPRTQAHRAYFARMAERFLAPLVLGNSDAADDDARSAAIRRQWHSRQLATRA